MSKRSGTMHGGTNGMLSLRNQGSISERFEEKFERREEQLERWRQEHDSNVAYEQTLDAVSSGLVFTPVDYDEQLDVCPFPEPEVPSFDHLMIEMVQQVSRVYSIPLKAHLVVAAALPLLALLFPRVFSFTLLAVLSILLALSLTGTLQKRRYDMKRAVKQAKQHIENKRNAALAAIEDARTEFEFAERQRVQQLGLLLEGDFPAIAKSLDQAFEQVRFPFAVTVQIAVYTPRIVHLAVDLPPISVIPERTSTLLVSGKIDYQDKPRKGRNKQYLDLVAAVCFKVVGVAFGAAPTVQEIYLDGFVDPVVEQTAASIAEAIDEPAELPGGDCILGLRADRATFFATQFLTLSPYAALNLFSGTMHVDQQLKCYAVTPQNIPSSDQIPDVPERVLQFALKASSNR